MWRVLLPSFSSVEATAEAEAEWVPREQLGERPVTTVTRKILALMEPTADG